MTTAEISREEVIAVALLASTEEQCNHARGRIVAWMQEHPRDFGMLDAGEQVEMILDGHRHESIAAPLAA